MAEEGSERAMSLIMAGGPWCERAARQKHCSRGGAAVRRRLPRHPPSTVHHLLPRLPPTHWCCCVPPALSLLLPAVRRSLGGCCCYPPRPPLRPATAFLTLLPCSTGQQLAHCPSPPC